MSENVKKVISIKDLTLQDLRRRARFDMFVALKPGVITWFPDRKITWCYRGDKFTDVESRMLSSLVRVLIKKMDLFKTVEIYDNDFHFQNEDRIILKISSGVVEKNILDKYKKALDRVPLPDYLKR